MRQRKNDPLVEKIEIEEANPKYVTFSFQMAVQLVSLGHLASMTDDRSEDPDPKYCVPLTPISEKVSDASVSPGSAGSD